MELSIKILKLIKLEPKKRRQKKKKSKADPFGPRWGGGHAMVGGEKRLSSSLCHPLTIFERERERERERAS